MTNGSAQLVQKLWNYCHVLRDESLEDSANLPEPDILAAEIMEDLQTALDQFAQITADLGAIRSS